MTAILLVGGRGTRLHSVVSDKPKCMIEINGKPFLSYILNYLNNARFNHVILAVGYLKEQVINFFGYKYKDIKLSYSLEEFPLGTGGAIKKASKLVTDDTFFVLNGDTYFNVDFREMFLLNSKFTIAAKFLNDTTRYGELIINNNSVIKFNEKKFNKSGYKNGGIYLIDKFYFESLTFNESFSFDKDI
jgi:D-glycero-alpha-D-manno-heptose 1-phosphate guanylyltransferase